MDNVKQLDDLHEALASTESELRDARETLARVEAERDQWQTAYWKQHRITSEAQAQLAEAVVMLHRYQELLSTIDMGSATAPIDWCSHFRNEVKRRTVELGDFLARHAQAEQQESLSDAELMEVAMFEGSGNKAARRAHELGAADLPERLAPKQDARGAQAGEFQREDRYLVIKRKDLEQLSLDVRMPFILVWSELGPLLPKREYLVIESDWPEYEPTWAAIQARAALATQPAAGEPVAWRFQTCSGGRWHVTTNKMHARIFEGTEDGGQVQGLFAVAPSAAAHGDEAVRKDAERYAYLRDMTEGLDATVDAMIAENAAMRVQTGEGGEV